MPEGWFQAFFDHLPTQVTTANALPADCVVDRFTSFQVPQQQWFSLIGKAETLDLARLEILLSN
jgi:hypothetical protein